MMARVMVLAGVVMVGVVLSRVMRAAVVSAAGMISAAMMATAVMAAATVVSATMSTTATRHDLAGRIAKDDRRGSNDCAQSLHQSTFPMQAVIWK